MNPAEDYILRQEEPYKSILLHLQVLIEGRFNDLELRYKYKIPFYYLDGKPFCYLNVPKKKDFVEVGFWASAHLSKYNEYLVSDGRKVMKSFRYKSVDAINQEIFLGVLDEAYSVNHKGFWK
ncbi:MAG: DUF1801 domain-containing protein [Flavobacteriaceae bacterium]|nr:DUF1801 domain-containing protein [Flavobacteriaceae bacterium]